MLREEIFQLADLTQTEAKVISVMLRLGHPAGPSEIASAARLFRPQAYDALERMRNRNLVSYVVKNRRRVYSISDTKAIASMLQKKREELDKAIPEVLAAFSKAQRETVTILTGIKGMRTMYGTIWEQMKSDPKHNFYRVMLTDATPTRIMGAWFRRWHLKRAAQGMTAMIIFTPDAAWRGKQLAAHANTHIRYFKGMQKIPVGLYSCGKYAYVIFWDEESPFAIQIEDKKVATSFVEYFDVMWEASDVNPPKGSQGSEME